MESLYPVQHRTTHFKVGKNWAAIFTPTPAVWQAIERAGHAAVTSYSWGRDITGKQFILSTKNFSSLIEKFLPDL